MIDHPFAGAFSTDPAPHARGPNPTDSMTTDEARRLIDAMPTTALGHVDTAETAEAAHVLLRHRGLTVSGDDLHGPDGAIMGTITRLATDAELVQMGGRWRPTRPDPTEYVPGDVIAIRQAAIQPTVNMLMSDPRGIAQGPGGQMALTVAPGTDVEWRWMQHLRAPTHILDAMPYFLDADIAGPVMESAPPDSDTIAAARLPFRHVLVVFSRPLALPDTAGPLLNDWSVVPTRDSAGKPLLPALRDHGTFVDGVVVYADSDGHLLDNVTWLLCSGYGSPDVYDGERVRGYTEGWLGASTLAPLVYNLAMAVAWGDWSEPEPPPAIPSDAKGRRKAWKKGAVKRADRRGAFADVRVLDAPKMYARRNEQEPETHERGTRTRRAPSTHIRRGHWRRTRVGPRDAWHYEYRWLPPVLVNPGQGDPTRRVYRLPDPRKVKP